MKRDDVVDILKEAQALFLTKRTQPSFDQVQILEKMPKIMYTWSPPATNVRLCNDNNHAMQQVTENAVSANNLLEPRKWYDIQLQQPSRLKPWTHAMKYLGLERSDRD